MVGAGALRRFLRRRWPADPPLPAGVIRDLSAALVAIAVAQGYEEQNIRRVPQRW